MTERSPTPDAGSDGRPLVSIVTPSFNQAPFLEFTMRSALEQTYPHVEYIVMDGGSDDGSASIIERYADRLKHWQSRPDKGFADAIRRGFEHAAGEIMAYLNSDDLLAPDAVEKAVAYLRRHPEVDMVYGDRVCIDDRNRLLYHKASLPWFAATPYAAYILSQESCFWRRSAYERVGGMNDALRFAIDYDLFSRFAKSGRFAHVRGLWGFFRKHASSKTIREYYSVGQAEGRAIQEAVWGGVPPRWMWVGLLMASRLWGTVASRASPKPVWPACIGVPAKATFRERLRIMFPEGSLLRATFEKLGI